MRQSVTAGWRPGLATRTIVRMVTQLRLDWAASHPVCMSLSYQEKNVNTKHEMTFYQQRMVILKMICLPIL